MRHFPSSSQRRRFRLALLALAGAGLSGCQGHRLPSVAGSTWRPTGVVQSDLEAQLADRHDLIRGRGTDLIPASIVLPGIEAWENGAAKGPQGAGSGQTSAMPGGTAANGSAGASGASAAGGGATAGMP